MKYAEMTAVELKNVSREDTMVVLPIAAVEQHGPHMPTGTDDFICTAVAEAVEQNLHESLLLLPTLWLGASQHHLRWGATLTPRVENYETLLYEIVESVLNDGFRRVLILNGHGGNIGPMQTALRRLQVHYRHCQLLAASYWSIAEQEIAAALEGECKTLGHACEAETSLIMHLRPDLVRPAKIDNFIDYEPDLVDGVYICRDMFQRTSAGATGRPDLASAEKGARMFSQIVTRVTSVIAAFTEAALTDEL
ncbi:Creatinine amidohydrolase [Gimesia panareensis]|uniref:Creatinine amidohydrolase n=1 Tax=Gimesia panareensis TaxID=2527978 RepID=A0A517Q855_9PLAN|nr:creatininase family protein [Gimesia panareensis]QDT27807.1 Creatinine amidohydrolase [Gimesia panareensis]